MRKIILLYFNYLIISAESLSYLDTLDGFTIQDGSLEQEVPSICACKVRCLSRPECDMVAVLPIGSKYTCVFNFNSNAGSTLTSSSDAKIFCRTTCPIPPTPTIKDAIAQAATILPVTTSKATSTTSTSTTTSTPTKTTTPTTITTPTTTSTTTTPTTTSTTTTPTTASTTTTPTTISTTTTPTTTSTTTTPTTTSTTTTPTTTSTTTTPTTTSTTTTPTTTSTTTTPTTTSTTTTPTTTLTTTTPTTTSTTTTPTTTSTTTLPPTTVDPYTWVEYAPGVFLRVNTDSVRPADLQAGCDATVTSGTTQLMNINTVESFERFKEIYAVVAATDTYIWIGLSDLDVGQDQWVWSDGTAWSATDPGVTLNLVNGNANDDQHNNQAAAKIDADGNVHIEFLKFNVDSPAGYICEATQDPTA